MAIGVLRDRRDGLIGARPASQARGTEWDDSDSRGRNGVCEHIPQANSQ